MAQLPYEPPSFQKSAFNCPICGAFAKQTWFNGLGSSEHYQPQPFNDLKISVCYHCRKYMLWHNGSAVFPRVSVAPPPNPDIPADILQDYEEAQSILCDSPRGSAALLRLCIQKLCVYLGKPGKNLNEDIAALVREGLPLRIQQSLDIVRVVGNEAVHPGVLDLRDQPDTAAQLCRLVNLITEFLITQPNAVDALYEKLPPEKREQIEKRDRKP